MTPLDQTIFGGPDHPEGLRGNCMQASWASLLDLPLDEVPHFAAEEHWWQLLTAWLWERGYALHIVQEPWEDTLGCMAGKSPRGDFMHLVVARGAEVLHDPHPSRAGIDGEGVEWYYLVRRAAAVA